MKEKPIELGRLKASYKRINHELNALVEIKSFHLDLNVLANYFAIQVKLKHFSF
jgi:hypothetical protein